MSQDHNDFQSAFQNGRQNLSIELPSLARVDLPRESIVGELLAVVAEPSRQVAVRRQHLVQLEFLPRRRGCVIVALYGTYRDHVQRLFSGSVCLA